MPSIPIRPLTSKDGVKFNIQIEENVSPAFAVAEKQLPITMRAAFLRYGRIIKQSVKEEYFSRRTGYANSPNTIARKGGKPALEKTGNLKEAVSRKDGIVIEERGDGSCTLKVEWKFPTAIGTGIAPMLRKNNNFVYLWSHEFGTEDKITQIMAKSKSGGFHLIKSEPAWGITRRDFFIDGVQKGIDSGSLDVSREIAAATDLDSMMERSPYLVHTAPGQRMETLGAKFAIKKPIQMEGLMPDYMPHNLMAVLWFIVPPSIYYAYIGAAYDIAGFLRGSFFSWGIAGNYAKAMAFGRAGISKKIVRRKIRGRLWGRD